MPTSLLVTKLFIPPPRAKNVLRLSLIDRLNEGLQSKLTLISASAGFGKTTLVSEWIATLIPGPSLVPRDRSSSGRGKGVKAAWLSLDEDDQDPTRFLTYLITSLQTIAANIGNGVLAILQSPEPPPTEAILTALVNEISTIPDNFVLVLDDYHVLDAKPVDNAITFLLEHMPPQMHLVIATREDPQLPLARLRARGQLIELRATDLRFTSAEAGELLNGVMGLNLSEDDIAALESRTEGWIAGLQLAAISMHGHPDATSFIKSFTGSHHFILDYLVEEVLHQQPDRIRTFLQYTSILDRLCSPLCEAILGTPAASGRETLEYLEHANLFIIPMDDERRWYRYHQLFADILRMHLMTEHPDQVPVLHRRASEWYEHNGLAADAIRHALAAKDFERAAILVELSVPEIRKNRQGATVTELGWLKALPDDLVRFRPVLCVDYAYALFGSGELEAVESRLRDAERWLDPTADTTKMVVVDELEFFRLPGMIALLRAAQALHLGDMAEAAKNARRVLDLAPEDAYLMLGGAASVLGLAAWASGDLEVASQMTAEGMENVRRAGYISSAIGGAIVLADIQIVQGLLHEAMNTYRRALQWATAPGTPVLRGAADMHVGMSNLLYEHNDLKNAMQHLLSSQALGEHAGLSPNPYRWRAAMARIRQAEGGLAEALSLLEQAEHLYDGAFSPNVRPVSTRKIRVWVAQGRLSEALSWAHEQGLSVDNDLSYLLEFDHITLARVLIARYKTDRNDRDIEAASGLLARLLKAAEEGGRLGSAIEILVLQALAYHAQGELPAALLPLQNALALAEPEGYVRVFLDEGASMMQLLRGASSRDILPDYANKLLAAFEAEQQTSEDKLFLQPASTAQSLIEPLSPRELEILHLITKGLTNRQIGERLFLALDTVKGHNRIIFDKLQVQSRTEAAARAHELGLL